MDNRGYELIIEELLKLLDSGVYIVDADGRGLFYNEAMAAMEEINVEDVVGKEYHRAFPGVPLNESTLYKALNKRLATRNKEQTYKNLYGKEITTINSTVPVIDGGQGVAAVEVAKDITNIRSMSDRILTLQETKIERSKPVKPTIKKYTPRSWVAKETRTTPHTIRGLEESKRQTLTFTSQSFRKTLTVMTMPSS